jgi:DNA-binding beta-propeller fold protein YncE
MAELSGRIVLLSFWTYSSVECVAILDVLRELQKKHRNQLIVIGAHCAKYPAQRSDRNVAGAVLRHHIGFPVVNDFDFELWRKYSIRDWPTFVLVDTEGRIASYFSGREALPYMAHQLARLTSANRELPRARLPLRSGRVRSKPLWFPTQLAVHDETNRLFVADTGHHRILVCDLTGRCLDVIGRGRASRSDGTFEQATFRYPHGMALDGDHLYVADTWNHLLRRCNLKKRIVSTVAGTGEQRLKAQFALPGRPLQTRLSAPHGLLCFQKSLFITMAGAHQLWVFDLVAQQIGPYAGAGFLGRIDGPAGVAAFAKPSGLAYDGSRLYVCDSEGNSVRAVTIEPTPTVSTLVGVDPFEFGDSSGPADQTLLQYPSGLASGREGIYVADSYNNKIKRIVRRKGAGLRSETLFEGDEGSPFWEPSGLALAGHRLYIADRNNHAIRVADLKSGRVETLPIRFS